MDARKRKIGKEYYRMKNDWFEPLPVRIASNVIEINDWRCMERSSNALRMESRPIIPFLGTVLEKDFVKVTLYKTFSKERMGITRTEEKEEMTWAKLPGIDSMPMIGKVEFKGEQAGTIEDYRHDEKTSFIKTLALVEKYRGLGIGTAVISLIVIDAAGRGSTKFVIEEILSAIDGKEYEHNLEKFKRIARKMKGTGIISRYKTASNGTRNDLILSIC
jgi:GNAT superfamily N-acetyltransferase